MPLIVYPTVGNFGHRALESGGPYASYPEQSSSSSRSRSLGAVQSGYMGSLGGYRAAHRLDGDLLHPFLRGFTNTDPQTDEATSSVRKDLFCRLFADMSVAERTAGKTDYRAISILAHEHGYTNVELWVSQPASSIGTVSVWAPDMPAEDEEQRVERIGNETTAPSGASFSQPTEMSPLSLGDIDHGSERFLWIRRAVGAASGSASYDAFVLVLTYQLAGQQFTLHLVCYYHLLADIATITLSVADGGDMTLTGPSGRTYTATVKNSSAAVADPPGSRLWVYQTQPLAGPGDEPYSQRNIWDRGHASFPAITQVNQAIQVSTGVYRFDFRPTRTGAHLLVFDATGIQVSQQVEVSPW